MCKSYLVHHFNSSNKGGQTMRQFLLSGETHQQCNQAHFTSCIVSQLALSIYILPKFTRENKRKGKKSNLILKNTEKKKQHHIKILLITISREKPPAMQATDLLRGSLLGEKRKQLFFPPSVEAKIGVLLMNFCAKR